MDFSQLPKMSDTPKPPAPETEEPTPRKSEESRQVIYAPSDGGLGFGIASVWISLILGVILLMLGGNFGRWAVANLSGKEFATGWLQPDGVTPVKYFELQTIMGHPESAGGTAWSETGLFLMGIALLFDAALMFAFYRRGVPTRNLVIVAIFFTGIALALNVFVAFKLFAMGIMPLITMCAVLVGGMILFDHVPLLGKKTTGSR